MTPFVINNIQCNTNIYVHISATAENFEEEPTSELLESPLADGTIEEDFEAALTKGPGGSNALHNPGGTSTEMLENGPPIRDESTAADNFSGKLHQF